MYVCVVTCMYIESIAGRPVYHTLLPHPSVSDILSVPRGLACAKPAGILQVYALIVSLCVCMYACVYVRTEIFRFILVFEA